MLGLEMALAMASFWAREMILFLGFFDPSPDLGFLVKVRVEGGGGRSKKMRPALHFTPHLLQRVRGPEGPLLHLQIKPKEKTHTWAFPSPDSTRTCNPHEWV